MGNGGKSAVLAIMSVMRNAVSEQFHLQNNYTHQEDFRNSVPFHPYDRKIENTWRYYYSAINQWLAIKDVDASLLNCYQSFIDTHLALAYYQLSSRWGGVPFIMQRSNDPYISLPRTDDS